jgi:chromosome segregation ATPase
MDITQLISVVMGMIALGSSFIALTKSNAERRLIQANAQHTDTDTRVDEQEGYTKLYGSYQTLLANSVESDNKLGALTRQFASVEGQLNDTLKRVDVLAEQLTQKDVHLTAERTLRVEIDRQLSVEREARFLEQARRQQLELELEQALKELAALRKQPVPATHFS